MTESTLRKHALQIFQAALKAADPVEAVRRHVRVEDDVLLADGRKYRLKNFEKIFVVGAGKAGAAMAKAVETLLGRRISGGFINVKDGPTLPLRRIELNEASHPVPDERGVRGAERIAEIVSRAGEKDLVLCLISGGASALMPAPAAGLTLEEKRQTTKLLLNSGASIHEINSVRKHLSLLKGGQLARLASPATVLSLLLSDVIGDDLDVIGSGPAAPDSSTFADARDVLEKYGISSHVPAAVKQRIEDGISGVVEDTPKPGDPIFERTRNVVVGSNRLAVDAAVKRARELNLKPLVLSTFIEGETREIARMHAAVAKEILTSGRPLKPPCCLISGGETTVTILGEGLGGRNQEFVL
ncbi:MAG: DUF4147 domain-containing protein, partial [Bryobacteraceae bacterium]|nr:DUF4147 domain-containing protein [Bryobacteraceae bacterium]